MHICVIAAAQELTELRALLKELKEVKTYVSLTEICIFEIRKYEEKTPKRNKKIFNTANILIFPNKTKTILIKYNIR